MIHGAMILQDLVADLLQHRVLAPAAHEEAEPSQLSLPPPIRALRGGAGADRLGSAFASGYLAATAALFGGQRVGLSVTEQGGGHPEAIRCRVTPEGEGLRLIGEKIWATLADRVDTLMVLADAAPEGPRRDLVLLRVPTGRSGPELAPMPATPFCPEIRHFRVKLDLWLPASARLSGAAWERYIRPFRSVEDLHVCLAATAMLIRQCGPDPRLIMTLAALLTLIDAEPEAPTTVLGLVAAGTALRHYDPPEATVDPDFWRRWHRDRALFSVAEGVRARRAELAHAALIHRPIHPSGPAHETQD